jgi:hypothetical protein
MGLELLHLALSPPHRLMRVFGAIIFSQPLLMWAGQSQTPERGGVRAQLIGANGPAIGKMSDKLPLGQT